MPSGPSFAPFETWDSTARFLILGKRPKGGREPTHPLYPAIFFSHHSCKTQQTACNLTNARSSEILCFRGPFHCDSPPASSSASRNRSLHRCRRTQPGNPPRPRTALFAFTFFRLDVITLLSSSFRHDDVFPVEHLTGCPGVFRRQPGRHQTVTG